MQIVIVGAGALWSKFVAWSGLSALAVLTRLPTCQFLSDPDTALLAARVMRETGEVAKRLGIELQDSGPLLARTVTTATEAEAVRTLQTMGETLRRTPRSSGSRFSKMRNAVGVWKSTKRWFIPYTWPPCTTCPHRPSS